MTTKQPQAGEWWQKEDTRVCIVGTRKNGLTVGEMQSGTLIPFMSIHGWQHLPDCDSFEWQPEVWPQYWTTKDTDSMRDVAFIELKQDGDWVQHYRDGGESLMTVVPFQKKGRTQLTKEQAEALVDKPQTPVVCSMCGLSPVIEGTAGCKDCTEWALDSVRVPVESPDDWVEITDPGHVLRSGIDQFVVKGNEYGDWKLYQPMASSTTYRVKDFRDVRCRRKDLPPLPSPKRVPVRLYWYDGNIVGRYDHSQPTDPSFQEIHSNGEGRWYVVGS